MRDGERPRLDTSWKELDELHACGLSPVDVIHSATGAVTHALGQDDEYGSLRPGQRADIIGVDGDVASDIRLIREVRIVMQGGKTMVSAATSPAIAGSLA